MISFQDGGNKMILTVTMNPALDKIYIIDNFEVDKIHRINNMEVNAAGKGVNVARVIKQTGTEVIATGIIGGTTGQYIKQEINQVEIINEFVKIKDNTRTNIKVVDNDKNTTTELLEAGPEVSSAEKNEFLNHFKNIVDDCEIIAGCGSLPPALPNDFYQKLIKIARGKNSKFILDTSGESLKKGIREKPYMIKPNREEVENLMGQKYKKPAELVEPLREFRELGIKLPVITLGADGCITLIEDQVYYFPALSLEAKNVVGSGDAFIAGCAVGLKNRQNIIEVIKLGMACAHANTQFYKTGMISKNLVDKYYDLIKPEKIT